MLMSLEALQDAPNHIRHLVTFSSLPRLPDGYLKFAALDSRIEMIPPQVLYAARELIRIQRTARLLRDTQRSIPALAGLQPAAFALGTLTPFEAKSLAIDKGLLLALGINN